MTLFNKKETEGKTNENTRQQNISFEKKKKLYPRGIF